VHRSIRVILANRLVAGHSRHRSFRLSKETKVRAEGAKDLGVLLARRNPIVDNIANAVKASSATYKLVTGKKPPNVKRILQVELPAGIKAAETGK
jgi:hypothetical protein